MRSFGMELEWSNVAKSTEIPERLGYWEGKGSHSEIDIINYIDGKFITAWPNKEFGGEINTRPTLTIEDQVNVIIDIHNTLQPEAADKIYVTPISNGHVHVRDSAFTDVEVLKRLYEFTIRNQQVIIGHWLELDRLNLIKSTLGYQKNAWHYMRNDGGKRLSENFLNPVLKATTPDEFYRAIVPHAKESGNILWARAGRQGINLHSLRHTGTIEFRCMKASAEPAEILEQLRFANDFVDRAINGGDDWTEETIKEYSAVPTDPHKFFWREDWKLAQDDWWATREERKKSGVKSRIGLIEL